MSIQVSSVPEQTGLSSAAQQRTAFLDRLILLAKQTPSEQEWLQALRDRASTEAENHSFPTARDEEWRFTDLTELTKLTLEEMGDRRSAVNIDGVDEFSMPETEGSRLVFVNGVYAPGHSTLSNVPDSIVVSNLLGLPPEYGDRVRRHLAQLPGANEIFTTLNTLGMHSAAVVYVPKNAVVEHPIHILFVSSSRITATLIQPRLLVVAEANSSVTIVENHVTIGQGEYFTNPVTEIVLEENAEVNHTRVQRDSDLSFHIGKTAVTQARSSRYTCNAICLGAKVSRHNLEIYQTGEQTETHLNGLTMIGGEQTSDTHSAIALTRPYGMTRQLHKCIVDDRGHAVFNGKVFVPQAAQLTDAGQLNRNLLLSPKARVDTKPQLEIVADNVKCTHGATVGQLDADEIFYLQSRGIAADDARKLLIYAFACEIFDRIPIPTLRDKLAQLVTDRT